MKKKLCIVIGIGLLLMGAYSCEPEDHINSLNSDDPTISIDRNSSVQLEPNTLSAKDIEEESCDDPVETTIYAGQHIKVGKILISNDKEHLFVTYDLNGSNWWLKEAHLFAGNIEEAPFSNSGNPKIGKFPYHWNDEYLKTYTFSIPLNQLGTDISIIAHGVVVQREGAQSTSSETAFGYGDIEFEGNRWGWIINYQLQDCSKVEETEGGPDSDPVESGGGSGGSGDGTGSENDTGCMDAYAFNNSVNSLCLLDDFDTWGWTNNVPFDENYNTYNGVTTSYPLYASAYQCDINNSMLVGEVTIKVTGGDGRFYGQVTVNLTNPGLTITDLDIYAGSEPYPADTNGDPTISFDAFDIGLDNLNVQTYQVYWLDWYDNTNFIVHASVCPAQ